MASADTDGALNRRYLRLAFLFAGTSALTMVALHCFVARDHWFFEAACILGGVSGGILVITLPICVLTIFGHPPVMTLVPLVSSRRLRARWREMRQRPELSDNEFYERFYKQKKVRKDVPLRLRAVFAETVGISRVFPEDRAVEFDEEMEFAELLLDVAEEFQTDFSEQEAAKLAADGTFDALVRHLAERSVSGKQESELQLADSSMIPQALRRRRFGLVVALVVVGVLAIGLGFVIDRLEGAFPGVATVMKALGAVAILLGLLRGDFGADH